MVIGLMLLKTTYFGLYLSIYEQRKFTGFEAFFQDAKFCPWQVLVNQVHQILVQSVIGDS